MPIAQITRRNILQILRSEGVDWSGRLDDVDFLKRIYDLDRLPSHDHRFDSAAGDIWQHTVNNPGDWDDYWIFDDERFNLLGCPDEQFLRFLTEIINPIVRPESKDRETLLKVFNEQLEPDGYQIVETTTRFGSKRYEATGILQESIGVEQIKEIAEKTDSEHLQKEIVRMTNAIETDPELAIGTAKEFIETISKTILTARGKSYKSNEDLPKLVHMVIDEIKLGETSSDEKVDLLVRRIVGNLNSLTGCIAELRNLHGTGHGKAEKTIIVQAKHAVLAVNAAITIGLFFYRSFEELK
jgi:hypothetical protein